MEKIDNRGKKLGEFCKTYIGGKNHSWRGNKVKYRALHDWVNRWKGKPNKCEKCNSEKEKRYDWANISKKYKRELTDWIRLCRSCHLKSDNSIRNRKRDHLGRLI